MQEEDMIPNNRLPINRQLAPGGNISGFKRIPKMFQ